MKAFTLIEVLGGIAVIAVLTAVALPIVGLSRCQILSSAADREIQTLNSAYQHYLGAGGVPPASNSPIDAVEAMKQTVLGMGPFIQTEGDALHVFQNMCNPVTVEFDPEGGFSTPPPSTSPSPTAPPVATATPVMTPTATPTPIPTPEPTPTPEPIPTPTPEATPEPTPLPTHTNENGESLWIPETQTIGSNWNVNGEEFTQTTTPSSYVILTNPPATNPWRAGWRHTVVSETTGARKTVYKVRLQQNPDLYAYRIENGGWNPSAVWPVNQSLWFYTNVDLLD